MTRGSVPSLAVAALLASALPADAARPDQDYLLWVLSESSDLISLVRFGPSGMRVDREMSTGLMPVDLDGPHGIDVSPDREFFYVSLGHGRPYGNLLKYRARDGEVLGQVTLGDFPASLDVSPDGAFAFIVNFNLHGDMVPSSVSIVATDAMLEVARVRTCTMPHGSRLDPEGLHHYSACMMDDALVELNARTFKVSRHLVFTKGHERGGEGAPAGHAMSMKDLTCSPTWAQPSSDGKAVYVACNKADEILEVDLAGFQVARRFPAGAGVYNLAVSRDGRLVATNKRGKSVSVIDLGSGKELARIGTRLGLVHGVVVSPDDRYAFVSEEGVGAERGIVEAIDLHALESAGSVEVGLQAAGIDFWKTEPPGR
jgi:DNA-binding beta-propeller fold protein YncE